MRTRWLVGIFGLCCFGMGLGGCASEIAPPGDDSVERQTSAFGAWMGCTAIPAPVTTGTTTSKIGAYAVDGRLCGTDAVFASPSTSYGSADCEFYVAELRETNPPAFGSSQSYNYEFVIPGVTQTQCPNLAVEYVVARYYAYIGPHWEGSFGSAATTFWHNGMCKGLAWTGDPLVFNAYEQSAYQTTFRMSVNARDLTTGAKRRAGVHVFPVGCVR